MRPSEDVLNEFYGLVEVNPEKRLKAISRLYSKVNSDPSVLEYCVERLVAGLSSARAAARFGYSTALVLLLSESSEHWSIEKLFALADQKLDLHDKESGNANAIAHHLLACTIFQSKAYPECESKLLERELEIYRLQPSLGMTVVQLLADIAAEMDRKTFKLKVLPKIKNYLETALTSSSVEFIYLSLLLKERFPSYISESVKFIQKDGKCEFTESDLTFLLLTVKKCDSSALEPFLNLLLSSAHASGQFSTVYRDVVEKWCTSGDESKVLERIFDTAKLTLASGEFAHKEMLAVFSPFLLKKITQIAKGKQTAQQRLMRGKITEFCKFAEQRLTAVEDDSDLLEIINALDTADSFDSLSGSNLVDHLVGRLSRDGVLEWIQTADKRWSLRHVAAAFGQWSSEAKTEALKNLLGRPKSEEIRYTVGNCVDSLFKIKVRAGELVNVALVEGGEDILKKVAKSLLGKDVVKSSLKKMSSSPIYQNVLPVFWICLKLWSKIASTDEMINDYESSATELEKIVKDGQEGLKVLLDQLLALLSQSQKYHRTVIYYVYVNLLSHIKEEHVNHILVTLMMDDEELVDGDFSDDNSEDEEDEDMEEAEEEEESELSDMEEDIDPTTFKRLEGALGKAAIKRKADAADEEESDVSDVDDAEMFAMDDRLAAAFKAMAPKKENRAASQVASAFRLKLADLLLFTLSSQNTPVAVKLHMIIPLLKLAKLQLKQDSEGHNSRKTISLLNIISKLKKVQLADDEVVGLLEQLITEGSGLSNPILMSAVASLSSLICSFGISPEGSCSDVVVDAFVNLFERFMTQEDGLIGCELAIAAVIKHPEVFVPRAKVFLKAGFNTDYRIFRRTEAVQCLAGLLAKSVQTRTSVEKSTVKGLGKSCTEYLSASLAEPESVKPRFFASVLKLLSTAATGISEELKPTLQKHLSLESINENESNWDTINKKINAACQQICGKSPSRVLDSIQNAIS